MKKINHQIRNLLKCTLVERIVISNHNPDVRIEEMIRITDNRLTLLNQSVRRGCGFRWLVAREFQPQYLVIIDDDMFLFPWQLASLFSHLVEEPNAPHGLSGMLYLDTGHLDFHDRVDMSVDFLCEVYAVTSDHLRRYLELRDRVITNSTISEIIDRTADFLVISQAGRAKPRIHNTGRLFRDPTFDMEEVALHKDETFPKNLQAVLTELDALELLHP